MTDLRYSWELTIRDNVKNKRIAFSQGSAVDIPYVRRNIEESLDDMEKYQLRQQGLCPECGTELTDDNMQSVTECPGCGYTEA